MKNRSPLKLSTLKCADLKREKKLLTQIDKFRQNNKNLITITYKIDGNDKFTSDKIEKIYIFKDTDSKGQEENTTREPERQKYTLSDIEEEDIASDSESIFLTKASCHQCK